MNQTDFFELERISQAIKDLNSYKKTEFAEPDWIKYRDGKMNLSYEADLLPFGKMDIWGGFDQYGWFRCEFTVPDRMEGKELWVEISQDKRDWYAQNPQFLLYCNGAPVQGMDLYHEECMLRKSAKAGEKIVLDFDAWSGMVIRDRSWSDKENRGGLFRLRFFTVNPDVYQLYYDLLTPYEAAKYLDRDSREGIRIRRILNEAVNCLDFCDPENEQFYASVKEADHILRERLYISEDSYPQAAAIGHTHIDVAWLWQFSHTKMKAQRSFGTALKLLDEYPEFIFMSSQPQLYEYMEENAPGQSERIKDYVRQGRWEPEGAMWVEADCNLTSGESLVRQFLMGKKYFKEKFGVDSRILWLPDVFGYSAALPQICKKSGVDYFMTTKISWNERNKIPYDTFMWKGIDGTEILTHFSPAKQFNKTDYNPFGFARSPHITTYNGVLEPDYVMGGWKRYSQKQLNDTYLFLYGYGDGGGGPTFEMIEKGRRMAEGIPGCPRVKFSKAADFFQKLELDVKNSDRLPVWNGELYLEFHRGTYTTAAFVKRMNRRAENLLQRTEFLLSAAQSVDSSFSWDKHEWRRTIQNILTNQFHDILPGSALDAVYKDVRKVYEHIFSVMENNCEKALNVLLDAEGHDQLAVINTLGFSRRGRIEFIFSSDEKTIALAGEDGEKVTAQKVGENTYVACIPDAAAGKLSLYRVTDAEKTEKNLLSWNGKILENDCLRVTFGEDGTLESVFDKTEEREVLSGPGNVLEVYEDRPYQYDAWEINPYYRMKKYGCGELISMELTEKGPVRACVRQTRRFLSSVICQNIYVYQGSKRIDFCTDIDWHEEHMLLKAAFPVDILAGKAIYEIQFGTVERPTHTNTSWDVEKFEVCAQRFADLAEPDYGAALLNDCKYGYDIHDGVMRITLLRTPSFPNAVDKGEHHFTYSFMPHSGTYREAEVQKEAYDMNNPLLAVWGSGREQKKVQRNYAPLFTCDTSGVFVETIKPAEDNDGFIARVYEGFGTRHKAEFVASPGYYVTACNMMEEPEEENWREQDRFILDMLPFEVRTFRIRMQKY